MVFVDGSVVTFFSIFSFFFLESLGLRLD